MLLVFPAMISLDIRRRTAMRSDILCCMIPGAGHVPPIARGRLLLPQEPRKAITRALPPDRLHTVTGLVDKEKVCHGNLLATKIR